MAKRDLRRFKRYFVKLSDCRRTGGAADKACAELLRTETAAVSRECGRS